MRFESFPDKDQGYFLCLLRFLEILCAGQLDRDTAMTTESIFRYLTKMMLELTLQLFERLTLYARTREHVYSYVADIYLKAIASA